MWLVILNVRKVTQFRLRHRTVIPIRSDGDGERSPMCSQAVCPPCAWICIFLKSRSFQFSFHQKVNILRRSHFEFSLSLSAGFRPALFLDAEDWKEANAHGRHLRRDAERRGTRGTAERGDRGGQDSMCVGVSVSRTPRTGLRVGAGRGEGRRGFPVGRAAQGQSASPTRRSTLDITLETGPGGSLSAMSEGQ